MAAVKPEEHDCLASETSGQFTDFLRYSYPLCRNCFRYVCTMTKPRHGCLWVICRIRDLAVAERQMRTVHTAGRLSCDDYVSRTAVLGKHETDYRLMRRGGKSGKKK